MSKKMIKGILVCVVLLLIMGNIGVSMWYRQKNAIFEDRCFVYAGNSYYAFGSEEAESAVVYFTLIDSKNTFDKVDVETLTGILQGEMGKLSIDSIKLEQSGKNREYDSYILSCHISTDYAQTKYIFDTLSINHVGDFEIGNLIVEKVETNRNDRVDIGYFGIADEKNTYAIYVEDVKTPTVFEKVVIKDGSGNEVAGEWLEDPYIAGDGTVSELHYRYKDFECLYLKPVLYYSCDGNEYVNTAKTVTAYKDEISKEEIEEYIRSHLE